ncbi:Acyl-CoA synthetase (AMP-forming)/AMP-acid ligase II [Variovorax sp. OK605]|uniref:class I adenylate-forming enzyme family protein n=1 Tax=Variovorax sp. OK605 TaxID=1855317 RepID=UPI0008F1BF7F|nr:AMP-binding protein [Variovorax sp. OK605]SFP85352.1 Acyl-CoA synthetase (AMP-forming)/AMP-acid ligase II [Variovorax sp. OK605]
MRPIDFLLRSARRHPGKTAISGPEGEISYAELLARTEALAAAFQALVPDARGRIAICAGNHIAHVVALFATLLAGRIWVPLNPRAGQAELSRIVEFTEAALVVTEAGLEDKVAGTQARRIGYVPQDAAHAAQRGNGKPGELDELGALIAEYRGRQPAAVRHDLGETQAIKFTGGTTGAPKGVMQSYRAWNTTIVSIMQAMRLDAHERYLAVASITHGTSTFLLPVLGCGGTVLLPTSTRPRDVLDQLEHDRVTAVFMPPTLIYSLLEDETARGRDWSALRHFVYAAAPMRRDKILEAQQVFGHVETGYGQTEAPAIISYMPVDDLLDARNLDSVGRAALMTEIAIMDTAGRLLPTGETGEVVVRGDLVMSGYWKQPEKTAETFHDGWLRTGDGGYLDERGFLFLKDRVRDMIITGGFNVYPTDVENALGKHPAVYDCAVIGVDDAKWGEAVHAAVQLRAGAQATGDELIAWVRARLDPVKTPKAVHFFEQLPRTANGKVSKKDARADIVRRMEPMQSTQPPHIDIPT